MRKAEVGWGSRTVTLGGSRTTGQALTRKGIDVRIRRCETIRKCLQEAHDLILLLIRQTEVADGHVDVVRNLGYRPAIDLFRLSFRTVSRRDLELKHIAGIVEMNELLQALGVAIVKELFLEIGSGRLSG